MSTPTTTLSSPAATGTPPFGWVVENGRFIPFWHSREGVIIKWSLLLGIFTLFSLYLIIGYTHAKRRLRKGLPPLAYHRWLVSRQTYSRYPYPPHPQPVYGSYQPGQYGMHAMPPPVYDPNAPRPPVYYAAEAKADAPSENEHAPPPPPPPEQVTGVEPVHHRVKSFFSRSK